MLEADIRSADEGRETIRINRIQEANYLIFIHDYSDSGQFPKGDVSLSVRLRPHEPVEIIKPKSGKTGRWWLACVFNETAVRCTSIDIVFDEQP